MAPESVARLAVCGSGRSCKSCGTFQNEIGALRVKAVRLLAADIPCGLVGAKVALQQEWSDWQAHSDQGDLGLLLGGLLCRMTALVAHRP